MDETDPVIGGNIGVGVIRVDDDHARFVEVEMPFDQRQRASPDGPETDHDNGSGDFGVDRVFLKHFRFLLG